MKQIAITALCCLLATTANAQKGGGKGGDSQTPQVAAQAKAAGPGPKTKAEAAAVSDLLKAIAAGPAQTVEAADNLVTKFPKSDYKSFALYQEADAYQQKGDMAKAQVFAEQALAADPKNYDADVLIANVVAMSTKDSDFDKEDKLKQVDKYAHEALEMVDGPPGPDLFVMTADIRTRKKNEAISKAWQALGTAALVRKNVNEAVEDFEKGVEANPDPYLIIRAGRALIAAKKYDDAITYYDKVLNSADADAQAKQIATSDKARATAAKGH